MIKEQWQTMTTEQRKAFIKAQPDEFKAYIKPHTDRMLAFLQLAGSLAVIVFTFGFSFGRNIGRHYGENHLVIIFLCVLVVQILAFVICVRGLNKLEKLDS